jgi:tRNA dimethylallyltransferase
VEQAGSGVEAVLIAGPTASGKSALALSLAKATGGVVVNADSMQVYRDLRVLTARPSPEEEGQAPHGLYGTVDGAENFSVGRYLAAATEAIERAWAENRLPILVGGTGLYFKALLDGLSDLPPVPEAVRAAVRAAAEGQPTPDLHAELSRRDPASAARLRPSDRLRVLRALEIHEATGTSLTEFQGRRGPAPLAGRRTVRLFLAPDREELRRRIDARFLAMIEAGALDEVRALAARALDPMLPVMRAHGVPGLIRFLDGETSLAEAVAKGQADTRAYAKRQFTWFRHQMEGWTWAAPEEGEAALRVGLGR